MEKKPGKKRLAAAACRKIKTEFGDMANGHRRAMFSVVAAAVQDAFGIKGTAHERRKAIQYLRGDIWHAQLCGVDPNWIRAVLVKMELKEVDLKSWT